MENSVWRKGPCASLKDITWTQIELCQYILFMDNSIRFSFTMNEHLRKCTILCIHIA